MEFVNATQMSAGYNFGLDVEGRELLVVVVKGTFVLPGAGEQVVLHAEQQPLVLADTFTGEPGRSAPVREADFAATKRACDVLLLGSAHAPGGRPASRVPVALRVGAVRKGFEAVGRRRWRAGRLTAAASPAEPFLQLPLSYDTAFGGVDAEGADPTVGTAFDRNPIGVGFRRNARLAGLDGLALPATEARGGRLRQPGDTAPPLSFGPVGRHWHPRVGFAGTYDQSWLDTTFPFLPRDFDDRYHQSAPPDQQMPIPEGPVDVELRNLTPDGVRRFAIPHFDAQVHVTPTRGPDELHSARLDAILLEPDAGRLTLTWRVTRPLRRDAFELRQVVVGRKGGAWWRAREGGKVYHPSLAAVDRRPSGARG